MGRFYSTFLLYYKVDVRSRNVVTKIIAGLYACVGDFTAAFVKAGM